MKNIFKSFGIFALVFAGVLHADGAEIFVSPAGKDRNPGTENAPLKTVAAAIRRARAGDTVKLLPGALQMGHCSGGSFPS